MTKELWINLPVKDVKKSIDFFSKIGFTIQTDSPGFSPVTAPISVGTKGIIVMLFQEEAFKGVSQAEIADTTKGTEVLFSFDAETTEEVDEMAKNVAAAGGIVFGRPTQVQGWMYGCGFTDLDGHRWNMLHMDMSKMKG